MHVHLEGQKGQPARQ